MDAPEIVYVTLRCRCGRVTASYPSNVQVTDIRCPFCYGEPKTKPPLRVVK